ncbi:MAG: hypothetical protein AAFP16_06915 [Pseudomonadota bacterium]
MTVPVAAAALLLGLVAGYMLAARGRVRSLAGLVCVLAVIFCYVVVTPGADLPGDGFAFVLIGFLIAPPMLTGVLCGALVGWRMQAHRRRRRAKSAG